MQYYENLKMKKEILNIIVKLNILHIPLEKKAENYI